MYNFYSLLKGKLTRALRCFLFRNSYFTIPFFNTETHIHVCDFHREKAWNEWVSKSTNGVTGYREEVLQNLRKIAKSANKMELDENIKLLKESKAWKSSVQLQKYFPEFWGLHLQVFQSK